MLSPFAKGFVLFFFFEFYHHTASSEGSEREEVWFKLVIIQKGSKDLSSHVNSYETMEFFNETMDSIIRNHWWTNHSVISMIHFGTRTWSEVSTNFRLIYGKWMESRRDSYVLMVNLRAWRVYIVDHTRGNNLRRGGEARWQWGDWHEQCKAQLCLLPAIVTRYRVCRVYRSRLDLHNVRSYRAPCCVVVD